MNGKIRDQKMDDLFEAILTLENLDECYMFFEDLCTVGELRAMEQRFHVARMLREGNVYSDIANETGASSATISRVNRSLNYGSDGYRLVFERIKGEEDGI